MGVSAGQCERVSCEFLWICVAASEASLSKCAIVDFECGVAVRQLVLISEIDLTPLWKSSCRPIVIRHRTPVVIGFLHLPYSFSLLTAHTRVSAPHKMDK